MSQVDDIVSLFAQHGDSQYGGEGVSQREHALQAALLAEHEGASAELIVAALLHDVGHLLHDLPDDAPEQGIDDRHETSASHFLRRSFPDSVVEPVRMHVDAKRFLCAVEPDYLKQLSGPSIVSLHLQGGPMSPDEVDQFRQNPHWESAVRLRRWDDAAKIADLPTPTVEYFAKYMSQVTTVN